jgi:DUF917 family protein
MARSLTADDVESALIGGLFLSAGGSGKRSAARAQALGRRALDYNAVRLVSLDELKPDDLIITATAIGAPGVADPAVTPRDSIDSARRLVAMLDQKPIGVICGHVPGFNAWLVAAALGLDYVDAASNGRGHPTVKMGGMGLASRPDISIIQVASSSGRAANSPLYFVAEGDIVRTSNVMRQAAVVNGGLIYAARGPLTAGFIKENGASGAITFQLELGRAMLRTKGTDRVRAAVEFLSGTLLQGEVSANTVTYSGGFDLGQVTVRGAKGEAVLGIYNEYMTADIDGQRVATFPDMIGTLDPLTGEPVAISELPRGSQVAVVIARRSKFPVGMGALDPAVFPEVEQAMGVDLRSYL